MPSLSYQHALPSLNLYQNIPSDHYSKCASSLFSSPPWPWLFRAFMPCHRLLKDPSACVCAEMSHSLLAHLGGKRPRLNRMVGCVQYLLQNRFLLCDCFGWSNLVIGMLDVLRSINWPVEHYRIGRLFGAHRFKIRIVMNSVLCVEKPHARWLNGGESIAVRITIHSMDTSIK
jgi:hypothetical protein